MHCLDTVRRMEEVQVLLALRRQNSGDSCVQLQSVLHLVADQWLGTQLDRSKLAHSLMHHVISRVLLIDEAIGQVLWALIRAWRLMDHLLAL